MIAFCFSIAPRNEENHLENQGGLSWKKIPLDVFKTHTLPTPPSYGFVLNAFQQTTRRVLQMGFPAQHPSWMFHTVFNCCQFSSIAFANYRVAYVISTCKLVILYSPALPLPCSLGPTNSAQVGDSRVISCGLTAI